MKKNKLALLMLFAVVLSGCGSSGDVELQQWMSDGAAERASGVLSTGCNDHGRQFG